MLKKLRIVIIALLFLALVASIYEVHTSAATELAKTNDEINVAEAMVDDSSKTNGNTEDMVEIADNTDNEENSLDVTDNTDNEENTAEANELNIMLASASEELNTDKTEEKTETASKTTSKDKTVSTATELPYAGSSMIVLALAISFVIVAILFKVISLKYKEI